MARIFISYSKLDRKLVEQYVELLSANHQIVWDNSELTAGNSVEDALTRAINNADGMIVFYTENGSKSVHVTMEVGLGVAGLENGKFLIPLVSEKITLPYTLQNRLYIPIDGRAPIEIVERINIEVARHVNTKVEPQSGAANQEAKHTTPISFATSLYDYISRLEMGVDIGGWHYDGPAKQAYGMPANPWNTDGFLFTRNDLSFILRSVARPESIYLVVESVNLKRQLVNFDLSDPAKFENRDGQITLFETYDMTVGATRGSRSEVRAAFVQAGMSSNIITNFNEREFYWGKIIVEIFEWAILRERVIEILQQGQPNSPEQQSSSVTPDNSPRFWLLKIFGSRWGLSSYNVGDIGYFNSFVDSSLKRSDYDFFAQIQVGEKGLSYDCSSNNGIVFFWEATASLHNDQVLGEIFSFRITQKLQAGQLPLERFASFIDFVSEIGRESTRKLFPLSARQYEQIVGAMELNTDSDSEVTLNTPSLSRVFSDSAANEIKDELDFQSDVDALAAVIAYKKVTPPLAVGLFGNWGTGKSFFMNKLAAAIKDLTNDKSGLFCKKVLQINFNSWHYSDANLWASLITKIFEDLRVHGRDEPKNLNTLLKNLHSTQALLQETKSEKAVVDKEIQVLLEKKDVFERDAKKQVENLQALTFNEIWEGLFKDSAVQEDFEKLKKEYSFLNLEELKDIENGVKEIDDFFSRLVQSFKLLSSFFKQRNVVLFLVLTLAFCGTTYWLSVNSGYFKRYLNDYKLAIGFIGTLISMALSFVRPAYRYLTIAFKRLNSFKDTVKSLREKADQKFTAEREAFTLKQNEAASEAAELQKKIELLEIQTRKLSDDIDDITAGRKIVHFIEGRLSDQRYINSLGIISWIRKDFEELDFLLCQQKDAQKIKEAGREPVPIDFDLERIVLYIDDLDRCQESLVVKVLEAINLLLAFPLFVVVVGVDPRWMHNALKLTYPHLKNAKKRAKIQIEQPLEFEDEPATSYDYLEKIFQIPFALKPMDQKGKAALIKAQLDLKAEDEGDKSGSEDQKMLLKQDEKVINEPVTQAEPVGENSKPISPVSAPTQFEQLPQPDFVDDKKTETPESDEKEAPKAPSLETLLISANEKLFMEKIAFLIGESPRTIKRYINIYRIIRTHRQFRLSKNEADQYYFSAMVMLAAITGLPQIAYDFLVQLSKSNENELFLDFLKNHVDSWKKKAPLLKTLADNMADGLDITGEASEEMEGLGQIKLRKFKSNLALVSRFSFRQLS